MQYHFCGTRFPDFSNYLLRYRKHKMLLYLHEKKKRKFSSPSYVKKNPLPVEYLAKMSLISTEKVWDFSLSDDISNVSFISSPIFFIKWNICFILPEVKNGVNLARIIFHAGLGRKNRFVLPKTSEWMSDAVWLKDVPNVNAQSF